MAISLEKWLVMVLLGVISFVLGIIPFFVMRKIQKMRKSILQYATYHIILTILSCFGAGVLLTTTAMHMIPEVRDSLTEIPEAWTNAGLEEHFPLAEVLMLAGFCLIYLIEEIAHFIMVDPDHNHLHHHGITRHNSMAHAIPVAIPGGPRPSLLSTSGSSGNFLATPSGVSITVTPEDNPKNVESPSGSGTLLVGNDDYDHSDFGSMLRSFLALIALSFHAIIEGIAIGIQDNNNVWVMFGAIASHKFVISFCMGMELCASNAKLKTILSSLLIFAVLSPVGIFIGSYLTSDESKSLAVVVIEGFASGTLLYVVFFEILNRERERKSGVLKMYRFSGFIQFLALICGLVSMGYLLSVNPHEHGDDHDHDECQDHTEEDHEGHSHDHVAKMVTQVYKSFVN